MISLCLLCWVVFVRGLVALEFEMVLRDWFIGMGTFSSLYWGGLWGWCWDRYIGLGVVGWVI